MAMALPNWKPIATIPSTGEYLVGVWVDGRWSQRFGSKDHPGDDIAYGDEPTHWTYPPMGPVPDCRAREGVDVV